MLVQREMGRCVHQGSSTFALRLCSDTPGSPCDLPSSRLQTVACADVAVVRLGHVLVEQDAVAAATAIDIRPVEGALCNASLS
jgi:hypothetical protein